MYPRFVGGLEMIQNMYILNDAHDLKKGKRNDERDKQSHKTFIITMIQVPSWWSKLETFWKTEYNLVHSGGY